MDNIRELPLDDERLEYSRNLSKLSFPAFAYRFQNKDKSEEFYVKVELIEGNTLEYLWVSVYDYNPEREVLLGKVKSKPKKLKETKAGSRVGVTDLDVIDLYIKRGDTYEGGFLAAAINKREVIPIKDKRSFFQKAGWKR